uniref:Uncharacterized conserved protein, contains Mth938-like domain n=1 Tax=Candidatus Kentrum sp. LPFa TaxID=2126335 RepID=A0A450W2U0_9GAMM|nr:MAG: Uncharacterized conserved protein, contains Mth938-like domain [Candidatus Kentron sp. LPFa]VFK29962.1 MAG: Uncharacterized conserved protein, contains Mth938-like domain [Candidatus Kentron sp. LPFa]
MSLPSITLQVDDDAIFHRVTAYGEEGYVVVDGKRFTHSLILTPRAVIAWPPQAFHDVTSEHVALVMEFSPEIVLFGSGGKQQFPAQAVFRACYEKGIGVETMNTAAACRTYNLLAGEGRGVVAALLMPSR